MDNKVLDEAVEVALLAVAAMDDDAWPDDYGADDIAPLLATQPEQNSGR